MDNIIDTPLKNDPLTMGIVLRGLPNDIQLLLEYIEKSNLTIVYKNISYGKLYISDKEESNDKKW